MATRISLPDLYWRLTEEQRPPMMHRDSHDLNSDRVVIAAGWTRVRVLNQAEENLITLNYYLNSDDAAGEYAVTQHFAYVNGDPGYEIEVVHWFSDPNTALEFRLTYG
ncbi:MAG: hypothetical protein EOP84_07575 [Verrucomicrobiaceae bacterium]|nr:MAG: hypothetical protein EOP84_07575 [Verrucomicrobiaceae bacterium]